MCSVSNRIISSGVSNSIVCSVSFFCSRLAIVMYVVCRCCNKDSFKKKMDSRLKKIKGKRDRVKNKRREGWEGMEVGKDKQASKKRRGTERNAN